jgi:putative transposase
MRRTGLQGARRGRRFITTRHDDSVAPAPEVEPNSRANRPDELWVVDFTYVPTWAGMRSPRSSPTSILAGSWAGAPPHGCRPSLPSDALGMAL